MAKSLVVAISVILSLLTPSQSLSKTSHRFQSYIDKRCAKDCVDGKHLKELVTRESKKHDISGELIMAIIDVESRFKIKARNGNSVGLMQVLLKYHKVKFSGKDFFLPNENVRVGSLILSNCFKKAKKSTKNKDSIIKKSLACYNGGGNSKYTELVMNRYTQIKKLNLMEST